MKLLMQNLKSHLIKRELSFSDKLYDEWPIRTMFEGSPHREVHDIWLRFRDPFEMAELTTEEFCNGRYTPQWYPCMDRLRHTKKIIEKIFTLMDGEELGGCLITKIPPGKQVYLHSDMGYNCEHYLNKYLLLVESSPEQYFEIGGERIVGEAGDLFLFDNRRPHCVVNNSATTDRVSLIISIKQKGQMVGA